MHGIQVIFTQLFRILAPFLIGASFLLTAHHACAQAEEEPSEAEKNFLKAKQDMLQWSSMDQVGMYEDAKTKATASGQTLLVLISATWCGYCPSLVAEMRSTLAANPPLSARYLLHPVVVQTSETIDNKLYAHDSVSGMRVAHTLFEPFAEGSNITFNQAIAGFPTLLIIDPRNDSNSRVMGTGHLERPQEAWGSGQYHDQTKIVDYLNSFSFKVRCTSLFGK